jgi:hypothetical protein
VPNYVQYSITEPSLTAMGMTSLQLPNAPHQPDLITTGDEMASSMQRTGHIPAIGGLTIVDHPDTGVTKAARSSVTMPDVSIALTGHRAHGGGGGINESSSRDGNGVIVDKMSVTYKFPYAHAFTNTHAADYSSTGNGNGTPSPHGVPASYRDFKHGPSSFFHTTSLPSHRKAPLLAMRQHEKDSRTTTTTATSSPSSPQPPKRISDGAARLLYQRLE